MGRRGFNRELKLEAVRLVTERQVAAGQAVYDLDIGQKVVSRWVWEARADKQHAPRERSARQRTRQKSLRHCAAGCRTLWIILDGKANSRVSRYTGIGEQSIEVLQSPDQAILAYTA